MRITADTNLLVRLLTEDDVHQNAMAKAELDAADSVAITLPVLCELVWVLKGGYAVAPSRIAEAVRALTARANVAFPRAAVEAGLSTMMAGGDFADGVIAFEGAAMGSEAFVSFDQAAVRAITNLGGSARTPRPIG